MNFYKFCNILEYNYDNPSRTKKLYDDFVNALTKFYGGKDTPTQVIFTDEVVSELGFDFSELKKLGIIERTSGGYQLNKDLVGTKGKLGISPGVPYPVGSREETFERMRRGPKPPPPPLAPPRSV